MVKSLSPSSSPSAKDGSSDGPPAGKKPKAEAKGGGRKRGQQGQEIASSQGSQGGQGSATMEVENTGGQKQQAGEQKTELHKEKTARLLKLMVRVSCEICRTLATS